MATFSEPAMVTEAHQRVCNSPSRPRTTANTRPLDHVDRLTASISVFILNPCGLSPASQNRLKTVRDASNATTTACPDVKAGRLKRTFRLSGFWRIYRLARYSG